VSTLQVGEGMGDGVNGDVAFSSELFFEFESDRMVVEICQEEVLEQR